MADLLRTLSLIEQKCRARAAESERLLSGLARQQAQLVDATGALVPHTGGCDGQSLAAGHEAWARCSAALVAIDSRVAAVERDRAGHHAAVRRAQLQKERLELRRHRDGQHVPTGDASHQKPGLWLR